MVSVGIATAIAENLPPIFQFEFDEALLEFQETVPDVLGLFKLPPTIKTE